MKVIIILLRFLYKYLKKKYYLFILDGQFKVSPSKVQRFSTGTTPGKSILKSSAPNTHDNHNHENGLRSSTKKLSNICFSPFNGVKVITHRSDMMEYGEDLWIANILSENENDDDDEYSYFDDDNDDEVDDESEDDDDNNDDNEMNEENNEIDEEKEESMYVYDYPLEYDVEL